jgi:riboflavin kinase/FMN adenylyltransferase
MKSISWLQNEADFRELRRRNPGPMVLTIGNFDGVHAGHQHIFTRMRLCKQQWMAVLTFRPHPVQVLFPERKHLQLFTVEDQKSQLEGQSVDWVLEQNFDKAFARLNIQDFLKLMLEELFQPQAIVVGYDFNFAVNRSGTATDLKAYCQQKGIYFEQAQAQKIDSQIISTTQIRNFLSEGSVQQAKLFLKRCFYLQGHVVRGEQRGRALGFPTANLQCLAPFFPRPGVYAGYLVRQEKRYKAVANLGFNPTFQAQVEMDVPLKVEVHVMDFQEDLYGQHVCFEFEHFLRVEKKFSGLEELKSQIQLDVKTARELLK